MLLALLQQMAGDLRASGMHVQVRNIDHADGTPAVALVIDHVRFIGGDFVLTEMAS